MLSKRNLGKAPGGRKGISILLTKQPIVLSSPEVWLAVCFAFAGISNRQFIIDFSKVVYFIEESCKPSYFLSIQN